MTLIIVDPHYLHIMYLQIRLHAKICNPTINTQVLSKSFVDTSNTIENTSYSYSQLRLNKVTHCLVSALINVFFTVCATLMPHFLHFCVFFCFLFHGLKWLQSLVLKCCSLLLSTRRLMCFAEKRCFR